MGNVLKGYLSFYKDGVSVPASYKAPYDHIFLNFNEHKFRDIVETLRLEKPLFIRLDDANRLGYVATREEPIGEEE